MADDYVKKTAFPIDKFDEPIGALKPDQSVSLSGDYSNTTTSSFSNKEIVRITALNDNARIAIGSSPSAGSNDTYLPQDLPEYFTLDSGEKISVSGEINLIVMR